MKLQYHNIEYIKGVPETFVYNYTQPGFKNIVPMQMYNGQVTGNTISRRTIELILMKENETNK